MTGMCMGSQVAPALGMEWKAIGSTMHSAAQTAAMTILLT